MRNRRDLKRAMAREDLHLHYQPIVEPRSGAVVSAEALLRGRENDRRQWNIADITAEAEQTTDIFELDQWIIEQACREWKSSAISGISLNLNVSAREFQNRDFLRSLDRATRASSIEPNAINFEITETASIHQPSTAEKVIGELHERGYHIWLDDFGTGHSSLAWLKWFPVQGLKIPASFVRDIMSEERSRIIIDGVIQIAKGLSVTVAAEGVENKQQLAVLMEKGVDLVQGFLFYMPLSIEELRDQTFNDPTAR